MTILSMIVLHIPRGGLFPGRHRFLTHDNSIMPGEIL